MRLRHLANNVASIIIPISVITTPDLQNNTPLLIPPAVHEDTEISVCEMQDKKTIILRIIGDDGDNDILVKVQKRAEGSFEATLEGDPLKLYVSTGGVRVKVEETKIVTKQNVLEEMEAMCTLQPLPSAD